MLIGGTAIGRLAIGQADDASASTAILAVTAGSFVLTGQTITFQVQESISFGSFTLTGKAATVQLTEAVS